MSKGINCLDNTVLSQLLGTSGVDELKSKIIDVIVEEVRDQLQSSSQYIISPDDVSSDIYHDVIEAIEEEIKEEYKEKIAEAIAKKMEGLGI